MPEIRPAQINDLSAIQALYNDAILNSTAVYEYEVFDEAYMLNWWKLKQEGNWPVIVVEVNGQFAGFGTFGKFRDRSAYSSCVEHSLYVHSKFQSNGLGKLLLNALIEMARREGKHSLVGGIDASNDISLKLHRDMGFVEVGRMPEVAYKFDRWLELVFMQYILT
jgi:L-amino acid N-acyltransferase